MSYSQNVKGNSPFFKNFSQKLFQTKSTQENLLSTELILLVATWKCLSTSTIPHKLVMQGKQFFKFSSPCMFKKLTTAFLSKEAENYKVPPASGITGNNLGMREREEKY